MHLDDFNIQGVYSKFPRLVRSINSDNRVVLRGHIDFDVTHCDTRIIDTFELEVIITDAYPNEIPKVRDVGRRIKKKYGHIYSDMSLCLATEANIHIELYPNYDLVDFFRKFVVPYLFSYSYFEKYKIVPYGERSHGAKGIIEYYMEFFKVGTNYAVINLLNYTCFSKYRGHDLCPCRSGKKVRNCHKSVIQTLKEKGIEEILKKELELIKNWEENPL